MIRCAVASAGLGEPLGGTAPQARAWLAIEQAGPWGNQALTESHLEPGIGAELALRAHGTGVTPLLIRRPGRHADHHRTPEHRAVLIAHTGPERPWLRRLDVPHVAHLLELDLEAIGAGTEPDLGEPVDEPALLVCTNAKRDQCCAVEGRPAAYAAAAAYPGQVWECTHLGGHRFAATALQLPHGFVHGRLDRAGAVATLELAAAGRLDPATLRGRSCWDEPAQAAETHLRQIRGLDRLEAVTGVEVEATGPDRWSATVRLEDGRTGFASVRLDVDPSRERAESCVKTPVPLRSYTVTVAGSDR